MKRIVAFDFGGITTGVVVADVRPRDMIELVHFDVIEDASKEKDVLWSRIADEILPYVQNTHVQCLVVLENIVWYPNWAVKALNKRVKTHFTGMGIRVKSLLPSQKATARGTNISSGDRKARKAAAISAGRDWLVEILGESSPLVARYEALPRKHDVADALMSIGYVYHQGF